MMSLLLAVFIQSPSRHSKIAAMSFSLKLTIQGKVCVFQKHQMKSRIRQAIIFEGATMMGHCLAKQDVATDYE